MDLVEIEPENNLPKRSYYFRDETNFSSVQLRLPVSPPENQPTAMWNSGMRQTKNGNWMLINARMSGMIIDVLNKLICVFSSVDIQLI